MREREGACPIEPRRTLRLLALRTSADRPLMGGRSGSMKVRLWEWEGPPSKGAFYPANAVPIVESVSHDFHDICGG